jgi:hypothetical protein
MVGENGPSFWEQYVDAVRRYLIDMKNDANVKYYISSDVFVFCSLLSIMNWQENRRTMNWKRPK